VRWIAVMVLIFAAGAARAQQLPSFDIEKHCKAAESGVDYCVERTQAIYSDLQQQWETIPPPVRAQCLSKLKTAPRPNSYYWLQVCVRREMMPPPPYRY
jgi:hypothetical protein